MSNRCSVSRHDQMLRRQAVQIVAQLPENVADAERVIELAGVLVKSFFTDDAAAEQSAEQGPAEIIKMR